MQQICQDISKGLVKVANRLRLNDRVTEIYDEESGAWAPKTFRRSGMRIYLNFVLGRSISFKHLERIYKLGTLISLLEKQVISLEFLNFTNFHLQISNSRRFASKEKPKSDEGFPTSFVTILSAWGGCEPSNCFLITTDLATCLLS